MEFLMVFLSNIFLIVLLLFFIFKNIKQEKCIIYLENLIKDIMKELNDTEGE